MAVNTKGVQPLAKNRVTYDVRDEKMRLVQKSKIFKDSVSACNFFQEIKNISVTKPVIEQLQGEK